MAKVHAVYIPRDDLLALINTADEAGVDFHVAAAAALDRWARLDLDLRRDLLREFKGWYVQPEPARGLCSRLSAWLRARFGRP